MAEPKDLSAIIPFTPDVTPHNIELIAAECQANDHIAKPFDIDDVVNKVVRLVDHQPLAS